MVRNVEGKGQKDYLLNYRGRCPQVLRKRGVFKEQPLEADGSETLRGCRVLGQVVSPPGSAPLFLKQTGCSFLWWHHRGQPASPEPWEAFQVQAELSAVAANPWELLAEELHVLTIPQLESRPPLHEPGAGRPLQGSFFLGKTTKCGDHLPSTHAMLTLKFLFFSTRVLSVPSSHFSGPGH